MSVVLVLNGSPRRDDVIATLLEAVAEGAAENHQVRWENIAELQMKPCTECLLCRPDGRCVLPEDDAHRLALEVRRSIGLAVGAPSFWDDVSRQLKVLLDRIVPAFVGLTAGGKTTPRHRGKRAAIITTDTIPAGLDRLAGESRGAVRTLRQILRAGGYEISGVVVKAGMRADPQVSDRLLARAREVGRRL